jgi:hypothetical protein
MALLSFVDSTPRAYRLKASNAAPPISTFPGAIPILRPGGLIEIDLGNRRRIRVDAHVDPEALARVLDVLERR